MERILIVRLGAMGDIIHALPAAADLRDARPQAEIDWVVENRWKELIAPHVANVITVDTKLWRRRWWSPTTWSVIAGRRRDLRERQYNIAIDFQGAIKSAVFARWAKTRVVGNAQPREGLAKRFYDVKVKTVAAHVIEQAIELAWRASDVEEPLRQFDIALLKHSAPELLPQGELTEKVAAITSSRFAILSPAAGWKAKVWPPERFGLLAKELAKDGIRSVVNIGPGAYEAKLADVVEQASEGAAQRVECTIPELIALTRRAALFVGGDTGPMHLANALGIPVVAIFGPTDPARNGPYYKPSVTLRSPNSRTSYSHSLESDAGIGEITVEQVLDSARNLLK